jgi:hypothetical protein
MKRDYVAKFLFWMQISGFKPLRVLINGYWQKVLTVT